LDVLKFLIDQGVDMNARTFEGEGPSPLNIAKYDHGLEHPVSMLLVSLGAEDHEDEWYDWEEEEEEGEEEEESDDEAEWEYDEDRYEEGEEIIDEELKDGEDQEQESDGKEL
jgi:hypothetical protein